MSLSDLHSLEHAGLYRQALFLTLRELCWGSHHPSVLAAIFLRLHKQADHSPRAQRDQKVIDLPHDFEKNEAAFLSFSSLPALAKALPSGIAWSIHEDATTLRLANRKESDSLLCFVAFHKFFWNSEILSADGLNLAVAQELPPLYEHSLFNVNPGSQRDSKGSSACNNVLTTVVSGEHDQVHYAGLLKKILENHKIFQGGFTALPRIRQFLQSYLRSLEYDYIPIIQSIPTDLAATFGTKPELSYAYDIDAYALPKQKSPARNSSRLALVVHIFYTDVLPRLLEMLSGQPSLIDLLITTDTTEKRDEILEFVKESQIDPMGVHVFVFPNLGRDIIPFFSLPYALISNYDLIGKIHIKKSHHLNKDFSSDWASYLVGAMLNGSHHIEKIAAIFDSNPGLGMLAPAAMQGTCNTGWSLNILDTAYLAFSLSPDLLNHYYGTRDLAYPSGTMFWFRPDALQPIFRSELTKLPIPLEPVPTDGTILHALERVLPYCAYSQGYATGFFVNRQYRYLSQSAQDLFDFCQGTGERRALLFTHDLSNSGAPRVVLSLAKALLDESYKIFIVSLGNGDLLSEFRQFQRFIILPSECRSREFYSDLFAQSSGIDLVIANTVVCSDVVVEAKAKAIPVVSLIHESASYRVWPESFFRNSLEADVCVFPGSEVRDQALDFCGLTVNNTPSILILPQPIHDAKFPRLNAFQARTAVRTLLGIHPDAFVVLGCGQIEERKGFDRFLHAYERCQALAKENPIYFVWIGPKPASPGQRKYSEGLLSNLDRKTHPYLILPGKVENTEVYHHASDLFFLSSRHDPYPYSVLEAMAVGTPILAYKDATSIHRAFGDGLGGRLVDPEDDNSAASAILSISQNPGWRSRAIESNRMAISEGSTPSAYLSTILCALASYRDVPVDASPLFSILVPAFETPCTMLQQLLSSIDNQRYPHWELVVKACCLPRDSINLLSRFAEANPGKVKILVSDVPAGISDNTNDALRASSGEFVCLVDHDDLLYPMALQDLYNILKAIDADVVFTDEDKVDAHGLRRHSPIRKHNLDIKVLYKHNYITHLLCLRRNLLTELGGCRAQYDGAQDYDLVLRCVGAGLSIAYLAKNTYSWRIAAHSTSSGESLAKPYAHYAGKRALAEHLATIGWRHLKVKSGSTPFTYKVVGLSAQHTDSRKNSS
ncbi:rhamnan synthesis F family protein [Cyanobium sp. NIES-981]|uniref:rhamnan synthesis F family protein n=1 Tax=Cyanobium sp. NIES-981 TaxID=1851505 RepID=UPI0007DD2DC9|nr:rhamnan synthesis F family protein [Cyanobium sp. NIES-981]SBO44599.1 protein of unknown function [Cyanobium sp. NIES-981]